MSEKKFRLALILTLSLCLLVTLAHFGYILYAYKHCSILYFIGKELW